MTATTGKPTILCVDDEPFVLDGLRDSLRRTFDVHLATSGREGLALLRQRPRDFAIVISDMRMPEMAGSVFLREARRVAPLAVRMLLTGYSEADAAIKAVNDGQIFRFLTKPCDRDELMQACAGALWQHRLQRTEHDLLQQTVLGAVKALTDVLALVAPAMFGQGARLKELVAGFARETGRGDAWEIEVAAMLARLGAITLPPETAEKVYSGAQLTAAEEAMAEHVPAVTHGLLANIPRLEGVLQILDHRHERFDAAEQIPVGARMLRIATDFLALENADEPADVALEILRGRHGVYDPELLESFACTVGDGGRGPAVTFELAERLRNLPNGSAAEPLRVTAGA
jgi:response regulator RpfG family c-di-GMP phosphodiesterase